MDSVELTYDNLSQSYDGSFQSKSNRVENDIAFSKIGRTVSGRTLDLGCGTGLIHDYLNIPDYVGIDISAGMLDIAKDRRSLGHQYLKRDFMDCRDLGKFDSIVSTFGSLSYCMTPHLMAKEIKGLLNEGGKFQFHVLSWRYYWRTSHISKELPFVGYSSKLLRACYKDFSNIRISGFNLCNNSLLMPAEAATIGKVVPDLHYYLVIEGENV